MKALLIAGGVALLVAILGTPLLINQLRARGIGQQIREDGPTGHFSKAGTPTMGGLAIVGSAVVGYSVAHVSATFTTRGLVGMLTVCAMALVGFCDDWLKVTRQRSLGLNKRAKIAGQFDIGIGNRLILADQTAKILGDPFEACLQGLVLQLAIGIHVRRRGGTHAGSRTETSQYHNRGQEFHAPPRRAAAIRGKNSRCQTSGVRGEMNL